MHTNQFGPWTTSLASGYTVELSAFWRQRMQRLVLVTTGVPHLVLRQRCGLLVAAIFLGMFPLLRAEPRAAGRGEDSGAVVAETRRAEDRTQVTDGMDRTNDGRPTEGEDAAPITPEPPVVAVAQGAEPLPAPDPHELRLRQVLQNAVVFLSGHQRDDGSWSGVAGSDSFGVGFSSMATLALVRAGVKPDDLRIRRAADHLQQQKPVMTYAVALQTLALGQIDPRKYAEVIRRNARTLERSQIRDGASRGSWSYGEGRFGGGDRSNAGFAVWGLDGAARAGIEINSTTWELALEHWLKSQNKDGSWGYSGIAEGGGTGSMTATGIAAVAHCLAHLRNAENPPAEAVKTSLERGRDWLTRNFAVGHNPNGNTWLLYYLLTLRRAGDATQIETFGKHDWRHEMGEYLASQQNKLTGEWRGQGPAESEPVLGTAMAILALTESPARNNPRD